LGELRDEAARLARTPYDGSRGFLLNVLALRTRGPNSRCVRDLIYDEARGDPDSGLGPGTRFEDIPYD
jgi:hypothetical protein